MKIIKQHYLRFFSLPIWNQLSLNKLNNELKKNKKLIKNWKTYQEFLLKNKITMKKYKKNDINENNEDNNDENNKKKIKLNNFTDEFLSFSLIEKQNYRDSYFVYNIIELIFVLLDQISTNDAYLHLLERLFELLNEILSQRVTRKYLISLLNDYHCLFLWKTIIETKLNDSKFILIKNLMQMLEYFLIQPLDDVENRERKWNEIQNLQYSLVSKFQQILESSNNNSYRKLIFASYSLIRQKNFLKKELVVINLPTLFVILNKLELISLDSNFIEQCLQMSTSFDFVSSLTNSNESIENEDKLLSLLSSLSSSSSNYLLTWNLPLDPKEKLNEIRFRLEEVLYLALNVYKDFNQDNNDDKKTEVGGIRSLFGYLLKNIWKDSNYFLYNKNEFSLPVTSISSTYSPIKKNSFANPLALPRLNLQFLTMTDYFNRLLLLYSYELISKLREEILTSINRVQPKILNDGSITSSNQNGWNKWLLPCLSSSVGKIGQANVACDWPSVVEFSLEINLASLGDEAREEWETLKEGDCIFILSLKSQKSKITHENNEKVEEIDEINQFLQQYGEVQARYGKIIEIRDETNQIIPSSQLFLTTPFTPQGTKRRIKLALDPIQYENDLRSNDGSYHFYESVNMVMRRDSRINHFLPIFESMYSLLSSSSSSFNVDLQLEPENLLPKWFSNICLGFTTNSFVNNSIDLSTYLSPSNLSFIEEKFTPIQFLDFHYTFKDLSHILEVFSNFKSISLLNSNEFVDLKTTNLNNNDIKGPYKVLYCKDKQAVKKEEESDNVIPHNLQYVFILPYTPPIHYYYSTPTEDITSNTIASKNSLVSTLSPAPAYFHYTPRQVEAIRFGQSEGLSLIVGPPGTGKTDIATQIINNIYQADSKSKILILTHSNAALNDIFKKLLTKSIDPSHMLRLGSGEISLRDELVDSNNLDSSEEIEINYEKMFSKTGRINYLLSRRLILLSQIQLLAETLHYSLNKSSFSTLNPLEFFSGKKISHYYFEDCDTAFKFMNFQVLPIIKKFDQSNDDNFTLENLEKEFPFKLFFEMINYQNSQLNTFVLTPLFTSDINYNKQVFFNSCQYLQFLSDEIIKFQPFEILRNPKLRTDYLLTNHARVIAMTCTQASLIREELLKLNFYFDSVIIEEAGQILEIETILPLLLQDPAKYSTQFNTDAHPLKRVVLLGDPHQLPPVVSNNSLKYYSQFEQSFFKRMIRSGISHVILDQQGRCREEFVKFFYWIYHENQQDDTPFLSTLPLLKSSPKFKFSNPGLLLNYQFINVENYKGKGEREPYPHYFENEGEAEYIVATYQYLRLLNYPASSITILTTYNGQKNLIKKILKKRCLQGKLQIKVNINNEENYEDIGFPHVSTVDHYQGNQNEIILLSLVRTENIGHFRDVRRLIVALSRARLGLYIFGRWDLFSNCPSLTPSLKFFNNLPHELLLYVGENYLEKNERISITSSSDKITLDSVTTLIKQNKNIVAIEDVVSMGKLVYQLFQQIQK